MKASDLVNILEGLPEYNPQLIQLAWKMTKEDGTIDLDKAIALGPELDAAVAEAENNTAATGRVIQWLMKTLHSRY